MLIILIMLNPSTTAFQFVNLILILVVFTSCQEKHLEADTLVLNAVIWTSNEQQPYAESMAIKGDSILAIGSNEEIHQYKGSNTKLLDMDGKFIAPGFIDSHVHLIIGGFNLSSVQLRDAQSPEEFIERIAQFALKTPKGTWIEGGDWDHENWGGELPKKEWIDSVTSNHPVFINRLDGHMALANSLALKRSEVSNDIQPIKGGVVEKSENGELTGIFRDNAMGVISNSIPAPTSSQYEKAIKAAMEYFASNGVTSVHQMAGLSQQVAWEALTKLHQSNQLKTRIYAMGQLSNWKALSNEIKKNGTGDKWLKIGSLKGFIDGSLGSHTAAFMKPYSDDPSNHGIFLDEKDAIYQNILDADKAGLQVAVHAIGDSAINFLLNSFERVQKINGLRDRRFRVEHAQHIAFKDIPRFSELNIIASMQPYHAIDDGRWAENLIGPERIKTTYAFKSLLANSTILAFGSDWFVAPPTPLMGIYAAVTRRTLDLKNPDGWVPEEKITVEQALMAYTKNAGFASFDEDIKGTLELGKLADFVVISEDITEIDPRKLKDLKILQTYVGGEKIFDISEN